MSTDQSKSRITNTTAEMRDDPAQGLLLLAIGMSRGGDPSEFIEAQERGGQRELVNSDRLPTDTRGTDEDFIAVGFTFGPPDPHDALFRPATLPAGWKRKTTDHAMHSQIVDELGRERVGIFYKAAYYDRRADMQLTTPYSYIWSALDTGTHLVLDETWLTVEVVRQTLDQMIADYREAAEQAEGHAKCGDTYWVKRAEEHRAEVAKAQALKDSL